jgi:hypothetical protein
MVEITYKDIRGLVSIIEEKKSYLNKHKQIHKVVRSNSRALKISNELKSEGIDLSEREVEVILNNFSWSGVSNAEAIEVLNFNSAVDFIESSLKREVTPKLLNDIHKICMSNLVPADTCGTYKVQAKNKVKENLSTYKSHRGSLLSIFKLRCDLNKIEPYSDGSTKVSKLLTDFLLLKHKYVPIVIPATKLEEYNEVVSYARTSKDYRQYFYFMLTQLNKTYDEYIEQVSNVFYQLDKTYDKYIEQVSNVI